MTDPTPETGAGLHGLDWIIISIYVSAVIGIGWYYGCRQKSSDEYFVGNRGMNPILVGVSMFATLFSTITYLGIPGEYISKGPVIGLSMLSLPVVYLVVGYGLVPFYMRRRVTSAYELLEAELGLSARMFASTLFVAIRLAWMAFLIYLPSNAILSMIGWEDDKLPWVVLVTGAVGILYASIGGLRAVVITDVLQFVLLLGGGFFVVASVTIALGGFSWFPTSWQDSWDTQPFFSADPNVRITVVGTLVGNVLWWVCTAGGDQTAIQRFMATGSPQAARRSFLINTCSGACVSVMLMMIGFSLLGYFQAFPERLPAGQTLETAADRLFPYYISFAFPSGVAGLILSALFAAAMSSIDSGVNSITAVVLTDYVDRYRERPLAERTRMLLAKWMAVSIGLIVVLLSAYVIKHVPGNYVGMAQRITNLMISPLFVLFFIAIFVPFGTSFGAICGALASSAVAVTVAYWEPIIETLGVRPEFLKTISFQWIQPCALTSGIVLGSVVSWFDSLLVRECRTRAP